MEENRPIRTHVCEYYGSVWKSLLDDQHLHASIASLLIGAYRERLRSLPLCRSYRPPMNRSLPSPSAVPVPDTTESRHTP